MSYKFYPEKSPFHELQITGDSYMNVDPVSYQDGVTIGIYQPEYDTTISVFVTEAELDRVIVELIEQKISLFGGGV